MKRTPSENRGRSPISRRRGLNRGASPFFQSEKWGRSPGFTLIEVLAALVIVALGMLGAITAVNQATRNGTYLREKTLAHWVAMNVVTERRLQTSPPDVTESSGEVDFANERWRWTMRVTQTEVRSLRRMDVSVRLASAPDTSSLASLSGFYGTSIAGSSGTPLSWMGTGAPGTGGQDDTGDDVDEGRERPRGDKPRPQRPQPSPEDDPE